MDWQTFRGHALVVLATISGIVGMGVVFDGAMHGSVVGISRGVPFLLMGLWWAGRELGRSMIASRNRRSPGSAHRQSGTRTPGTRRVTPR